MYNGRFLNVWRRQIPLGNRRMSTSTEIACGDVLDHYKALCKLGHIQWDDNQVRVLMQLRRLSKDLRGYTPTQISYLQPIIDDDCHVTADPTLKNLTKSKDLSNEMLELQSPKGLLLTGLPGSGKTFIADTWFANLPTPYKIRKHYNQFILDLYRDVWDVTGKRMRAEHVSSSNDSEGNWTKDLRDQVRHFLKKSDGHGVDSLWDRIRRPTLSQPMTIPIPYILASRLIREAYVLLLDEVQLQDVSSALLLSDVLVWYWRMGGVVVGTSNRVPEDLYVNGVQKERLGAFGSALRVRCPVVELGSSAVEEVKDYRILAGMTTGAKTWFLPHQVEEFQAVVDELLHDDWSPSSLPVFGRQLFVPKVSSLGHVCSFSFDQLCEESLGPADYLTVSSTFSTVIISDIPVIRLPSSKNQARRFISLVDALYEARCRVVCLAQNSLDDLFVEDADTRAIEHLDSIFQESVSVSDGAEGYRPNILSYDGSAGKNVAPDVQRDSPMPLETLSIFSGKDEQFAFKRAHSRLVEMTSAGYHGKWEPLPAKIRKWERSSDVVVGSGAFGSIRANEFAPRMKEDHVWGVREDWGSEKGGRGNGARHQWGKGASVYKER